MLGSSRSSAHTVTDDEEGSSSLDTSEAPIGMTRTSKRAGQGGISTTYTTVFMKDNVLASSSGYFLVKDDSGENCCRIHGEAASMPNSGFDVPSICYKNTRIFTDGWGHPLFTLRRKPVVLSQSIQAIDLTGNVLMETKSKFSFTKNRMTASLRNAYDGQELSIEVCGKWTGKTSTIQLATGRQLAKITRLSGDQYSVTVSPGVQVALAVALAVAFSERSQDGNRSAWTS